MAYSKHNYRYPSLVLTALLSIGASDCFVTQARAATANLPSSAEHGAIHRELHRETQKNARSSTKYDEKVMPEKTKSPSAPAGSEKIIFKLNEVSLQGITVFNKPDIAIYFSPYLGKECSVADLFTIADKITKHYQDAGYLLSVAIIPQQEIKDGKATITVVEGFVDDIILEGDPKGISRFLPTWKKMVTEARPLDRKTLQKFLLNIQRQRGVSISTVLEASEKTFGASTLRLMAKRQKPYDITVSHNNFGSRYIGPYQQQLTAEYHSAFGMMETLGVRYLSSLKQNELRYIEANGTIPLNAYGTELFFSGSNTDAEPGLFLKLVETKSVSNRGDFGLRQLVHLSEKGEIYISAKFDAYDTEVTQLDTIASEERLRVIRGEVSGYYKNDFHGVTQGSLEISQGLDVLDSSKASPSPNFLSRSDGNSDFTKVLLNLSYSHGFTNRLSLTGSMEGQLASDPLLSGEEFGFGGPSFGRGYEASEISGDDGISGSVELAYTFNGGARFFPHYQIYSFYDIGAAWEIGEDVINERKTAASFGAGIRANLVDKLSATFEIAQPLTRRALSRGAKEYKDPQYMFSLVLNF